MEPLYNCSVKHYADNQTLLHITGSRETVINTALRVILDSAPNWNSPNTPGF